MDTSVIITRFISKITAVVFSSILFLIFISNNSFAQVECEISQVTDTVSGESEVSFLNFDGTVGTFSSDSDIDGGNPDGSFEAYIVDTETFTLTQITDNDGLDSFAFDMTADDNTVSISSEGALGGVNPEGNREIFLYDRNMDSFTQITNTTDGDNIVPALNSDASLIAIDSEADLAGGNADMNREIFLYDSNAMTFDQLTNTLTGDSIVPDITLDGGIIGFHGSSDLVGMNPDNSLEVYLYDVNTMVFTQVTNGMGINSASVSLSSDASVIGFNSDTDPVGDNADNNRETFLFNTDSMTFTQVTDSSVVFNSGANLNADGTRAVFSSPADLTGDNADGSREIFLYESDTGTTSQVTDSAVGNSSLGVLSGDGTKILFVSNSDLTGENVDGNDEVFFAACFPVVSDGNSGCTITGDITSKQTGFNLAILLLALVIAISRVIRRSENTF